MALLTAVHDGGTGEE